MLSPYRGFFTHLDIAGGGSAASGVISRQHLKRIRLISCNDVSWAFMLINDSLQTVIAIPRLIVLSCSAFLLDYGSDANFAMLQNGGSAAAERPLLDAFVRRQDENLDDGFVRALLNGSGWVASKETADRARAACVTDSCRKQVDSAQQSLQPPIKVALDPGPFGYAMVGVVIVRGPNQFKSKISQFPKGTVFDLGTKSSANAYRKGRLDEARKIVEGAGMKLNTDEDR
jgi:hypothetical protein